MTSAATAPQPRQPTAESQPPACVDRPNADLAATVVCGWLFYGSLLGAIWSVCSVSPWMGVSLLVSLTVMHIVVGLTMPDAYRSSRTVAVLLFLVAFIGLIGFTRDGNIESEQPATPASFSARDFIRPLRDQLAQLDVSPRRSGSRTSDSSRPPMSPRKTSSNVASEPASALPQPMWLVWSVMLATGGGAVGVFCWNVVFENAGNSATQSPWSARWLGCIAALVAGTLLSQLAFEWTGADGAIIRVTLKAMICVVAMKFCVGILSRPTIPGGEANIPLATTSPGRSIRLWGFVASQVAFWLLIGLSIGAFAELRTILLSVVPVAIVWRFVLPVINVPLRIRSASVASAMGTALATTTTYGFFVWSSYRTDSEEASLPFVIGTILAITWSTGLSWAWEFGCQQVEAFCRERPWVIHSSSCLLIWLAVVAVGVWIGSLGYKTATQFVRDISLLVVLLHTGLTILSVFGPAGLTDSAEPRSAS